MLFRFSWLKKRRVIFCILILLLAPLCLAPVLPPKTEDLLTRVQHQAFDFFWNEANPANGLVKDRAGNFEKDKYEAASIASVGFALASLPAAVERKWIDRKKARGRALAALSFFADRAETVNGFYYHFLGMQSGKRIWKSELSSIDTAIFLAGAIVAREYFQDPKITDTVNRIYGRMDFEWMMNGGDTLSMGWKPESGFLKDRWSHYNEGILLTLLAMGAPKYSVPPAIWDAITRRKGEYGGIAVISHPPLFTHQYPQLFLDLRDKHDAYADYFENSKNATLANHKFCSLESKRCKTYAKGYWGLTACDGPKGYKAYGAEPGGALSDGTVAPTGAITSIMFTPEISLAFLEKLYAEEKDWLWGRYGFADSFNLASKWKSPDVIGIDQGGILLGIENYRTGLIWKLFQQAPEVKRALQLAGFKPGARAVTLPPRPVYEVSRMKRQGDWSGVPPIVLSDKQFMELGEWDGYADLTVKAQFAWDPKFLHFRLEVKDDSVMASKGGEYIWRNDCLEIFLDPEDRDLMWGDAGNFQMGFSPLPDLKGVRTWSWFQKEDPVKKRHMEVQIKPSALGYEITGKIRWDYLKVNPKSGAVFAVTPAFHDLDSDDSESKFTWHFISRDGRFELGKFILK